MRAQSRKAWWAGAALLSILVHGAGFAFFAAPRDEVLMAGGGSVGSVTLGNSFADLVQGNSAEPVEQAERVTPVDAAEEAQAVTPEAPAYETPLQPSETPAAAVPVDVASIAPDSAPAALAPVPEAVPLPEKVERPPVETRQQVRKPPAQANALPAGRPEREPAQQARLQGSAAEDGRRGAAGGKQARLADGDGRAARASSAGNAAVSNYLGLVWKRLSRARRSPGTTQARNVMVSFVIQSNGSVLNTRIVQSSGSSTFDNAAIDTVKRAAPFPPIPPEARRSEWQMTIPITFTR